jgi:hypothetical protein
MSPKRLRRPPNRGIKISCEFRSRTQPIRRIRALSKKAAPEKVRLAAYSEPAHRLVRRNRVRIHQPSHSIEWLLPVDDGVTPGSEQRARNLGSPDNSKAFPHMGHWVRRCSHASLRRSARPDRGPNRKGCP